MYNLLICNIYIKYFFIKNMFLTCGLYCSEEKIMKVIFLETIHILQKIAYLKC